MMTDEQIRDAARSIREEEGEDVEFLSVVEVFPEATEDEAERIFHLATAATARASLTDEPITAADDRRVNRVEVIDARGRVLVAQGHLTLLRQDDGQTIKVTSPQRVEVLVTDEMVEWAAVQMCATNRQGSIWAILSQDEKDDFRRDARAVLEAAVGA